jgi:crooked neck
LSRLPRSKSSTLYAAYTKFEKQHGSRSTLESTVLGKRRIQYEEEVSHDGRNYDVWFDYARLEEGALTDLREEGATSEEEEQSIGRVREVYERAVAQVPPGNEKRFWRRYIFLWLDYALFEEIETKVLISVITPATHQLIIRRIMNEPVRYTKRSSSSFPIKSLPLQNCGFCSPSLRFGGWICLLQGKFLVQLSGCVQKRRCLRVTSSWNSKYVQTVPQVHFMTLTSFWYQLREFDRVRQIYQKYIEWDPTNSASWIKYAELESQLEDFSRTRGIFELGISQPSLSMPELLWKAYIDFETEEGERGKARSLYERLIKLSGHVKVWISYALFEGEAIPVPRSEREEDEDEDEEKEIKMVEGDLELARQVFKRGYEDLRSKDLKSEVLATTSSFTFMPRLTIPP